VIFVQLHHVLGVLTGDERKDKQKTLEERLDDGRALRKQIPRSAHADWTPPRDRKDPLAILAESDKGRITELIPVRHSRMSQSPFTFYRGLAALMAADLALTPVTGVKVQACGDCHLQNFGGFATPERNLIFDINDFDETIPAPWEWDLKRLAVSAVLAGRQIKLQKDAILEAARTCVRSYRLNMQELARTSALDVWYSKIVSEDFLFALRKKSSRRILEQRIKKAESTNSEALFPKLTEVVNGERRIIDNPPLIYHPKQLDSFEHEMEEFLNEYYESLNHELHVLLERYRLLDVALKVVGIGSVGTRCAVALLMGENNDPLFLQFKEARRSVLEQYAGMTSSFHNQGQRVVVGQKIMQSASDMFLGWNSHKGKLDFYFRQLRDAKITVILENLDEYEFIMYLGFCARSLAQSHARSSDPALIAGYMGKSSAFDKSIADFAITYANQTERDFSVFRKAVSSGQLSADESKSADQTFES